MVKRMNKAAWICAVSMAGFVPMLLWAADARPWLDSKRSADERARLALAAMTLDEKIGMLHGPMAFNLFLPDSDVQMPKTNLPADAIGSAGYISGVPRLGIPALQETDASLGVTNPFEVRQGDMATALPAGLALGASFNPELAYRAGVILGEEAHAKGFNVLLGGGMNLARDPRNGRNFEYLSEDPLLSGVMAGETVRGTQSRHVISTVKHFALNAQETNRNTLDARIDKAALRESDLLAFELAIERGRPGSVMCAYNRVNGDYACGNDWLLNQVLKRDWAYKGWVMSDWGAVDATDFALKGLDQQSGEQLDQQAWFGEKLKAAVHSGQMPLKRVDDMVLRVLRSMFAVGTVDDPPVQKYIDYEAHAAMALEIERQGMVLLKNENALLPLNKNAKRIAVIGGNAHIGVITGGGSSQVTPANGAPTTVPIGGRGMMGLFRSAAYFPSAPLKAIRAEAGGEVVFDSGTFPADAAALAATADVAIVFVTRHELEGFDIPNLNLPNGQNKLIAAVAGANPRTIVVLETGNPAAMPWLDKVPAVLAAWYPGQEGGQAIADVLFGAVNPSGRLPITFPVSDAQTMRPQLPNHGVEPGTAVSVDYVEGADAGYRWYAKQGVKPLFAFGHGLSYSTFEYRNLKVSGGKTLQVSFEVRNAGARDGADVPQVYLRSAAGQVEFRLLGFERVALKAGERKQVTFTVEPRLLAHYIETQRKWIAAKGVYKISLGHSAGDLALDGETTLNELRF